MRRALLIAGGCLLFAACENSASNGADIKLEEEADGASFEAPRSADLQTGEGESVGTVSFREDPNGVTLTVEVSGLEPGLHGVHLHETGTCAAPDFSSAGGHWNPTGAEHGRDNPMGAHLGDLSNMNIDEEGTGRADYLVREVRIDGERWSLSDGDGTALVIHAGPDDYRTEPAGDAGSRVACSVLAPPREANSDK